MTACSGSTSSGKNTQDSSAVGGKEIPPTIDPTQPPVAPQIDHFSPITGNVGTTVTLVGIFDRISSVKFNGVEASSFSIASDHLSMTAVAPDGFDNGNITVENETGNVTSENIFESWCNPILEKQKSLVITDVSVVDDPVRTVYLLSNPDQAVWSFSYLMQQMKPDAQSTSDFILNWLHQWETVTSVNGYSVSARVNPLIDAWPKLEDGSLDLEKAPLRLLAITDRLDLRNGSTAGEGRFVFNVLDAAGAPTQTTFILEFKMPFENGETLNSYLQAWHDLSRETVPSEEYNIKLAQLTGKYAAKNFTGIFVNGSAIGQIRTNEKLGANKPWELREFHLDESGNLIQTTTFRNPDDTQNKSETLDQFMLDNQTAILAGTYVIPKSMIGGATIAIPTTQWFGSSGTVPEDVRHEFSLNTCSGCHSGETSTLFLHLTLRNVSEESQPSAFLLGDEDRRLDDMKNLVVSNLCSVSLQGKSIIPSALSNSKKQNSIVWVSRPDQAKTCSDIDQLKMDFQRGQKVLNSNNIKVFGVQKNRNRAFWKEHHSCDDQGGYLQCYQVKASDAASAAQLGFIEDQNCSENPYTRVH